MTTLAGQPAADLSELAVLVVDDEADIRLGLSRLLGTLGIEARQAASGAEALAALAARPADLMLSDLMMPGMTGAELLGRVKKQLPATEVVILTGYGTVAAAVSCLQAGAAHFLTKPFDNEEILRVVQRLGAQLLARRCDRRSGDMLASDPRTLRILELVDKVAPLPVPVLIAGESGTGKEMVARRLHERGGAPARPFQALNCAAVPDALLESELFGHVRGAFTGAARERRGLFESAEGGTVFLDEVSSMSPAFQGKLLRVLQEKQVRPVGGDRDRPVSFRLVAASNRDLGALVAEGAFRQDLYYRLAVVRVDLPALRERPGDVVPLARHFLALAAAECLPPGAPAPVLSDDAEQALRAHAWPGNVRELQNTMQRALVVCSGAQILPYHLALDGGAGSADDGAGAPTDYSAAKAATLERFQREFVHRALERSAGNVSRAASACGLTRAAFQKILRQLGIDRSAYSAE